MEEKKEKGRLEKKKTGRKKRIREKAKMKVVRNGKDSEEGR